MNFFTKILHFFIILNSTLVLWLHKSKNFHDVLCHKNVVHSYLKFHEIGSRSPLNSRPRVVRCAVAGGFKSSDIHDVFTAIVLKRCLKSWSFKVKRWHAVGNVQELIACWVKINYCWWVLKNFPLFTINSVSSRGSNTSSKLNIGLCNSCRNKHKNRQCFNRNHLRYRVDYSSVKHKLNCQESTFIIFINYQPLLSQNSYYHWR